VFSAVKLGEPNLSSHCGCLIVRFHQSKIIHMYPLSPRKCKQSRPVRGRRKSSPRTSHLQAQSLKTEISRWPRNQSAPEPSHMAATHTNRLSGTHPGHKINPNRHASWVEKNSHHVAKRSITTLYARERRLAMTNQQEERKIRLFRHAGVGSCCSASQ
jgi:hypothetical protein